MVNDGEMPLPALITRLGGIAATSELRAHGFTPEIIAAFVAHRQVIRIRRGWYGTTDLSPDVIEARRVGGRLGCFSALVHHGVILPADFGLHVAVYAGSSRLRLPATGAVLHWSRRPFGGDRQAVSVETALQQAARCKGAAKGPGRREAAKAAR